MNRSFASEATSLSDVRTFIRDRAKDAELYRRQTEDLVQAVSEICANAVLHGDGESFTVSWTSGPRESTEVKVRDQGVFASQGMGHRGESGGFGLPLVAALVDELSIVRGTRAHPGTTVRMVKHRDS